MVVYWGYLPPECGFLCFATVTFYLNSAILYWGSSSFHRSFYFITTFTMRGQNGYLHYKNFMAAYQKSDFGEMEKNLTVTKNLSFISWKVVRNFILLSSSIKNLTVHIHTTCDICIIRWCPTFPQYCLLFVYNLKMSQ